MKNPAGNTKIVIENPEIVTLRYSSDLSIQQKNLALLNRYYETYEKIFNIPEEVVPKEVYVKALTEPDFYPKYAITLQGAHFDNLRKATVIAFLHGEYYSRSESAFTAYVAAVRDEFAIKDPHTQELTRVSSKAVREANDAVLLEMAREEGKCIQTKFSAVNSPLKVEHDVMNPWERIRIMKGWGGDILPIDFVQPALSENTASCEILMLMSHPVPGSPGTKATPRRTIAFLGDFIESLNIKNVVQDVDYLRMKEQLEALEAGAVRPASLSGAMRSFLDKHHLAVPPKELSLKKFVVKEIAGTLSEPENMRG